MKRIIEAFQKNEPKGTLKLQKKGKAYAFYHQYRDSNDEWKKRYIKKSEKRLAVLLAQKQYYASIVPILEDNLQCLNVLLKKYQPRKIDELYNTLKPERKRLVEPIKYSKQWLINNWISKMNDKKQDNNFYPEGLRYETVQGDMVRSKSEVIIANLLYQRKDEIVYEYEHALELCVGGRVIILHPDFRILNLKTGRIVFWEHMGMLDDPEYANEFVNKVNAYVSNGYIPGRDVIFSCETSEKPLDTRVVKRLIDEICLD